MSELPFEYRMFYKLVAMCFANCFRFCTCDRL